MNAKKVAVLGSNSFSGSDFIDLLLSETDFEILGISRSPEKPRWQLPYRERASQNFTFMQANIAREANVILARLKEFNPDFIVNFAAQSEVGPSWDHPDHWFDTNVTGLATLIKGLQNQGYPDRYVHISSPEVYGTCLDPIKEDAEMRPSTPYAVSKASADMFLSVMHEHCRLPLVTVRSTNVYGPYQQIFKIIPKSVICLKQGKTIPLHGGGQAIKSFIHIRDVNLGTLRIMTEGDVGNIYHLSPESGISIRNIVGRICELMGKDFATVTSATDERLAQDAAYVIDSTRAQQAFGWAPEISLDEGLQHVISWIDKNWLAIQAESLDYVHKP